MTLVALCSYSLRCQQSAVSALSMRQVTTSPAAERSQDLSRQWGGAAFAESLGPEPSCPASLRSQALAYDASPVAERSVLRSPLSAGSRAPRSSPALERSLRLPPQWQGPEHAAPVVLAHSVAQRQVSRARQPRFSTSVAQALLRRLGRSFVGQTFQHHQRPARQSWRWRLLLSFGSAWRKPPEFGDAVRGQRKRRCGAPQKMGPRS